MIRLPEEDDKARWSFQTPRRPRKPTGLTPSRTVKPKAPPQG
jgi:hypothetical protein